jgi:hypothetical protein
MRLANKLRGWSPLAVAKEAIGGAGLPQKEIQQQQQQQQQQRPAVPSSPRPLLNVMNILSGAVVSGGLAKLSPRVTAPQRAEAVTGENNPSGVDIGRSDVAAKWMAAVSTDGTDEGESTTDNIFAVDIDGGLENVLEEEGEEEDEAEEPGRGHDDDNALRLRPEAQEQQQEEDVTSPWDRYISASDDQTEDVPGVDETDTHT